MRYKKFAVFTTVFLFIFFVFSGIALSAQPEDALSIRSDDSVYAVVKNEDLGGFLRWLVSKDKIKLIAPVLEIEPGILEAVASILDYTPIESTAMIIGINKKDVKFMRPFFQIAFNVKSESRDLVKKIASGNAKSSDIAKLLLGERNPMVMLADSMIKVESQSENILKVNNEFFVKVEDDLVIVGSSVNEVKASVSSVKNNKNGLIKNFGRRFNTANFAILHFDYETASELDNDDNSEEFFEFFEKPLNIEFGFENFANKFILSTGLNLKEALKEKYSRRIFRENNIKAIEGGNITLTGVGGEKSPLAALGTRFNFDLIKENEEIKDFLNEILKILRRFGVSESDFSDVVNGALSIVINNSVPFEGFKIPAIYLAHTGKKGAALELFNKLSKSQFFSQISEKTKNNLGWDKVLQIDSSLSPVSCLIGTKSDTLGVAFSEISGLGENKNINPELKNLMQKKSTGSAWIDFKAIQSWLNDDSNGVFAFLTPLATFTGYSKELAAIRDIVNAELSIPSIAFYSESPEVFFVEFSIADIDPENGVLTKLINLYKNFSDLRKK